MFGLVATKRSVDAVRGYSRVSKVYLKVQNIGKWLTKMNVYIYITKFVIITIRVGRLWIDTIQDKQVKNPRLLT